MAGKKRAAASPISIGNCKVEIEGGNVGFESSEKTLLLSVLDGTRIKISVDDSRKYMTSRSFNTLVSSLKSPDSGCWLPSEDLSFLLVNPKDADGHSKSLLQEVLKIYTEELPTMNYAANTGKESNFLERCILSGKYKTLILRSNAIKELGEIIAAVSYKIIPIDTQYAEIPLAAVFSKYQNKGIGRLLYNELRERLQNVGILTIFCWADKESEGFWLKQGFISIGEVDSKGKVRRLPIKADIRRALCFPGGSTLMVTHLKDTVAPNHSQNTRSCCSANAHAKPPSNVPDRASGVMEMRINEIPRNISFHEHTQSQLSKKDGRLADIQQVGEYDCGSDDRHCSSSGEMRRVWEASVSSLKSKRIRGGHLINCRPNLKQDLTCAPSRETNTTVRDWSMGTPSCSLPMEVSLQDCTDFHCVGDHAQGIIPANIGNNLVSKGESPTIMFMNIADDAKKTWLTKIVEELGASVTCNGSAATHVITGKARKTLNFCTALCTGAWIVSPNWLKASFKEGHFLGESEFILEDKDYLLKYKSELRNAVIRAKMNPCSLFRGYHICIAKHIQPSADVLSAIIKLAGGHVILRLDSIEEPSQTIFLACEEDMGEALAAAKKGVWTFSSDWFMSCVMRQQLDLEAPQFAESL